jgi:hypothetical protein
MLFFSISVLTLFNLLRGRGATGTVGDLGGLEIGRLLGILYCWNLLTENDGMLPGLMDGSFLEKSGQTESWASKQETYSVASSLKPKVRPPVGRLAGHGRFFSGKSGQTESWASKQETYSVASSLKPKVRPPVGRLAGQDEGNLPGTLDGVLLGRNVGVDVGNLLGGELARKVGPLGKPIGVRPEILVNARSRVDAASFESLLPSGPACAVVEAAPEVEDDEAVPIRPLVQTSAWIERYLRSAPPRLKTSNPTSPQG